MNASKANKTTRTKGVTLLEMLIVIAVIGLITALAGVGFNRYLQTVRLNEATRVVGDTLRRVSDQAITESRRLVVKAADISSDGAEIVWYADDEVVGRQVLPVGAEVTAVTPGQDISFMGRGLPERGAVLTVTRGEQSRDVRLLPTGMVVR